MVCRSLCVPVSCAVHIFNMDDHHAQVSAFQSFMKANIFRPPELTSMMLHEQAEWASVSCVREAFQLKKNAIWSGD